MRRSNRPSTAKASPATRSMRASSTGAFPESLRLLPQVAGKSPDEVVCKRVNKTGSLVAHSRLCLTRREWIRYAEEEPGSIWRNPGQIWQHARVRADADIPESTLLGISIGVADLAPASSGATSAEELDIGALLPARMMVGGRKFKMFQALLLIAAVTASAQTRTHRSNPRMASSSSANIRRGRSPLASRARSASVPRSMPRAM